MKQQKKKRIGKIRRKLIYMLGGFTADFIDDVKGLMPDYWKMHSAKEGLYINPENYKKEYKESIEKELATKIGLNILRNGGIFFNVMTPEYCRNLDDDMYISAHVNILKVKEPTPHHAPTYLKFEEDTDEQTDNISNS